MSTRKAAVVLVGWLLASCSTNTGFSAEGYLCDDGAVCPDGYACTEGVCRVACTGPTCTQPTQACAEKTCAAPPAAVCADASILRTFHHGGVCNPATGECEYGATDSNCPSGCQNGSCAASACTGVTCEAPPAAVCEGDTLRTFGFPATCNPDDGQCSYASSRLVCPAGCVDGACIPAGLEFSQVQPGVRAAVSALEQAPGSEGKHVVAVGPRGFAARWNGATWETLATGTTQNLTSVWLYNQAGTIRGWVVGHEGTLLAYDGTAGSLTPAPLQGGPTTQNLVAVHGVGDALAVAAGGSELLVYTGSTGWRRAPAIVGSTPEYAAVFAGVDGKLRAAGRCSTPARERRCVVYLSSATASAASVISDENDLESLRSNSFWAVGPTFSGRPDANESFVAFDGMVRLHNGPAGKLSASQDLRFLLEQIVAFTEYPAASATGGIQPGLAVLSKSQLRGQARLYWVDEPMGGNGSSVPPISITLRPDAAVTRNASSGLVLAESGRAGASIRRVTPGLSASMTYTSLAEDWIHVVMGTEASPRWLVARDGSIAKLETNGTLRLLNERPVGRSVLAAASSVDASGTPELILVGDQGLAIRWSGGLPSSLFAPTITPPRAALRAVCRVSSTEWYAVGTSGTAVAMRGDSFSKLEAAVLPTPAGTGTLTDVRCTPAGVFAVGEAGAVLKLSANRFVSFAAPPPGSPSLTSTDWFDGGLYVAGDGFYGRYAADGWSMLPSATLLRGLQQFGPYEAYGFAGRSLVRFNGRAWTPVLTTSADLTAVVRTDRRLAIVGEAGVLVEGR